MGPTPSYLISVGTAICGGSAIAAVGPVIGADQDEMSVALGAVFLLQELPLADANPVFAAAARRMILEVLADRE